MARTGTFGRLPAKAPDLSATIFAMYEQYESQRDKNMIDAWQNGGLFEGKKVTDTDIQKWFQMRRDQQSRQDPMWDYWNDQLLQTKFNIAEQKANLKYQRTVDRDPIGSNREMADFYRQWAQRLPRASQAWRDEMTSAAKFARAARAAAHTGASGSRAAAEQRAITNAYNAQVKPGLLTLAAVYTTARALGFVTGAADVTQPSAWAMNATGMANFDEMLAAVQGSDQWQGVSTQGIGAAIQKAYPHWDGKLTYDHVVGMVDRSIAGFRHLADIAQSYGDKTNAQKYRAQARTLVTTRTTLQVAGADLPDKYVQLHAGLIADLQKTTDPMERLAIYDHYATNLEALANDFQGFKDFDSAGKIRNEAIAARGGTPEGTPTYWEDATGASSGPRQGTGPSIDQAAAGQTGASTEAQAVALDRVRSEEDAQGLADGSLVMVYAPDNNSPTGESIQIVPRDAAQSVVTHGGSNQVVGISIPTQGVTYRDKDGKVKSIPAGVYTQSVAQVPVIVEIPANAVGVPDAQSGNVLDTGNSIPAGPTQTRVVGVRVDLGGGEVLWGTPTGPGGQMSYSSVPPFIAPQGSIDHVGTAADGFYHVEYDYNWAAQHDQLDPVNKILLAIDDASTTTVEQDPALNVGRLQTTGQLSVPRLSTDTSGLPTDPNAPTAPGQQQTAPSGSTPTLNDTSSQPLVFMGTGPDGKPIYMPNTDTGPEKPTSANPPGVPVAGQEGFDPNYTASKASGTLTKGVPVPAAAPPGVRNTQSKDAYYGDSGAYTGAGNIDLNSRQVVHNPDGSISTEVSKSFGIDGKEVLLPTIINGKHVSDAEAIAYYRKTGQNLGSFETTAEADAYAQSLHNRQQAFYRPATAGNAPPPVTGTIPIPGQPVAAPNVDTLFFTTLVTQPSEIAWWSVDLARAAQSPERRAEWAAQDPVAVWKNMVKNNPSIANDPVLQQQMMTQMDVLRGAGQAGTDERSFLMQQMQNPVFRPAYGNTSIFNAADQLQSLPGGQGIADLLATGKVSGNLAPVAAGQMSDAERQAREQSYRQRVNAGEVPGQARGTLAPVAGATPAPQIALPGAPQPVTPQSRGLQADTGGVQTPLAPTTALPKPLQSATVAPIAAPKPPKQPKVKTPEIKLPNVPGINMGPMRPTGHGMFVE